MVKMYARSTAKKLQGIRKGAPIKSPSGIWKWKKPKNSSSNSRDRCTRNYAVDYSYNNIQYFHRLHFVFFLKVYCWLHIFFYCLTSSYICPLPKKNICQFDGKNKYFVSWRRKSRDIMTVLKSVRESIKIKIFRRFFKATYKNDTFLFCHV